VRRTTVLAVSTIASVFVAVVAAASPPTPTQSTLMPRGCGEGACFRPEPKVGRCVPGTPQEGWANAPDPVNKSWDTNCDGKVEKEVLAVTAELGIDPYTSGCASELPARGGECVYKKVTPACGDKWPLFTCKLRADGKCHAGALKGEIVQRCR